VTGGPGGPQVRVWGLLVALGVIVAWTLPTRPESRARTAEDLALASAAGGGAGASAPRLPVPVILPSREAELLTRIHELEDELELERELRLQREQEWLSFTRAVSELPVEVPTPAAPEHLRERLVGEEAVTEVLERAEREDELERSRARLRVLRALMIAEQILSFDLLELGRADAATRSTGPVVARTIDPWGRPTGTLAADRLSLRCSRSAHTLTFVFENGFETQGGVATPFGEPTHATEQDLSDRPERGAERGGVRTMRFTGVDPEPWIETLPELFDADAFRAPEDDGRWDVLRVRQELNRLLREEATARRYQLRGMGGVVDGVLRDVQLVELDERGGPLRLFFADRLQLLRSGNGIQLLLEQGAIESGDRRAPFLDGRYRIFLPRASFERWKEARLPGLAPPQPLRLEEPLEPGPSGS